MYQKNEYPLIIRLIQIFFRWPVDQRSEKKKLVSAGGDPASNDDGMSTFSPDRSRYDARSQQEMMKDQIEIAIGRAGEVIEGCSLPSNLIFSPISVKAST